MAPASPMYSGINAEYMGDAGAIECIGIRDTKEGKLLSEGSATNVFIVQDGVIRTPPNDHRILGGITREVTLKLARHVGLKCIEEDVTEEELRSADEIWVTSATKEVAPITTLDGATIGTGRPGTVWRQVMDAFQQYKQLNEQLP
eukprot:NODE_2007_length_524_cov_223.102244_g1992_i0.p1 GENE.NODE_2007_length_524_cov_223.102244_g1992_i0~~NODE_2007_length_524_cov_223.102244_g1992_i0.p1  ORF type:complete len:145 (-),score=21.03 NODE_2007_length_524_cov_223.102244_g1992_i0:88-522(-)